MLFQLVIIFSLSLLMNIWVKFCVLNNWSRCNLVLKLKKTEKQHKMDPYSLNRCNPSLWEVRDPNLIWKDVTYNFVFNLSCSWAVGIRSTCKSLTKSHFIVFFRLAFETNFIQVPSHLGSLGKCCNSVLQWGFRKVLWTVENFIQLSIATGVSKYWLNSRYWVEFHLNSG